MKPSLLLVQIIALLAWYGWPALAAVPWWVIFLPTLVFAFLPTLVFAFFASIVLAFCTFSLVVTR